MYIITALVSIFAYVWLIIILTVISEDVIEVWEAVLTIVFFPLLVILCYMVDANKVPCVSESAEHQHALDDGERVLGFDEPTPGFHGTGAKSQAQLLAIKKEIRRRIKMKQATRTSKAEVLSLDPDELHDVEKTIAASEHAKGLSRAQRRVMATRGMFKGHGHKVQAEEASLAGGETFEMTATFGDVEAEAPKSSTKLDDSVANMPAAPPKPPADKEGVVTFAKDGHTVFEHSGLVYVAINREGGTKGRATVAYRTVDDAAVAGDDYVAASGTITFEEGEFRKHITVEVLDDDAFENDEDFFIVLEKPSGCRLGRITKASVTILDDDEIKTLGDKVSALLGINRHKLSLGAGAWSEQISDACDWPSDGSAMEKILWCLVLPWALINAVLSPPASICGGMPCFFTSLGLVGLSTACIGDFAEMFGCIIGLEDEVTAITLVALGTSLPDAFASKSAAVNDDTADAAITNVTGSNSVNVFLGLGLSWLIGAAYWAAAGSDETWTCTLCANPDAGWHVLEDYPGGAFWVAAGSLNFSVTVFTLCSICAFSLLALRRSRHGGELGGERKGMVGLTLVSLWATYVIISAMEVYGYIDSF